MIRNVLAVQIWLFRYLPSLHSVNKCLIHPTLSIVLYTLYDVKKSLTHYIASESGMYPLSVLLEVVLPPLSSVLVLLRRTRGDLLFEVSPKSRNAAEQLKAEENVVDVDRNRTACGIPELAKAV